MRDQDDDESIEESSREPGDNDATDSEFQTEAEVTCPYCGETMLITLDPDSGAAQEYVQDCEVCCRPWNVQVAYDEVGAAEVSVEESE